MDTLDVKILNLFKKYKPTDKNRMNELGIKLKFLDSGAFRDVYHIKDTNLVVKIPKNGLPYGDYADNLEHAKNEINAHRKVFKKKSFKALIPFMPNFHYVDYRHGIVVSEKYKRLPYSNKNNIIVNIVGSVFEQLTERDFSDSLDLSTSNMGLDQHGNYKFIDLGLLEC